MHPQLLLAGTQWAQLFVALSILILLHEFGHFFFAKLFKTRVEKFYLFFDFLFPLSGVLNFSLLKFRKGETQYGVGWFPLGGYVKIAGMVDESMDKEAMQKPPESWEYRSKPAWQRLLIMLGGIIVNVITAIVVYIAAFAIWGEDYLPVQSVRWGITTDSVGKSIGLQNGDKVLGFNNVRLERYNDVMKRMILPPAKSVQVQRGNDVISINIPPFTIKRVLEGERSLIETRVPTVVGEVIEKTAASAMKLKVGDSIISLNGQPVFFYDEFRERIKKMPNARVRLSVMRGSQLVVMDGTLDSNGVLGFRPYSLPRYVKLSHVSYPGLSAVSKGVSFTGDKFVEYWAQFKMLFTSKEVSLNKSLGGLGTFAGIFPTEFDWQDFFMLIAYVSIILAFMNLLPIPGLDGGYVIFLLYELITRRKVSERVMEIATSVGLILLLGLMLYANGLDIFRSIVGKK